MALDLPRRSFLRGLGSLVVVAPAIVRATSLMPVKVFAGDEWNKVYALGYAITREALDNNLYDANAHLAASFANMKAIHAAMVFNDSWLYSDTFEEWRYVGTTAS